MVPSHRQPPPLFPQPFSAPTAIPVPNGASNHLTAGHTQGSGRPPQNPSPRTTSSYLPPTYEQLPPQRHPSAYPPSSQHIPVSGRPPPAFPIPHVQITHAPTTRSDPPPAPPRVSNTHFSPPPVPSRTLTTHSDPPPPRVQQRGVTIPISGLPHDTQVAPGHYPSYSSPAPSLSQSRSHSMMSGVAQIPTGDQRYYDNSQYERAVGDYSNSAMHSGASTSGATPKGPPSLPAVGIQKRKQGNHKKQPPNRTQTQPAPVVVPTFYRCRLPGCPANVSGETAARLNGFCCDRDMWTAINNRIATLCPECKRRACLEGNSFCSPECANRRQFPRH